MIFLVDEDDESYDASLTDLEMEGFEISVLGDADEAYARLSQVDASELELAVLDVRLAVGDPESSRFDAERTDDFKLTGLELLKDLSKVRPDLFPARAMLITNTVNQKRLDILQEYADQHQAPFLLKAEVVDPFWFSQQVRQAIVRGASSGK